MINKEELKVGDKVLIKSGFKESRTLSEITKILKTGVRIAGQNSIFDYYGRVRGERGYHTTNWKPISNEEHEAILADMNKKRKLYELKVLLPDKINNCNKLEVLNQILLLLEESEK